MCCQILAEARNQAYNIISCDLVHFTPGIHDPTIIVCNECDNIHALLLQRTEVLNVRRKMSGLATRSESSYKFQLVLLVLILAGALGKE
jgi:hypothetical protein